MHPLPFPSTPALLEGGGAAPLVLTAEEVTSEEAAVDVAVARAIKPAGGKLLRYWGHTMYHYDDLVQGPPAAGGKGIFAPGA